MVADLDALKEDLEAVVSNEYDRPSSRNSRRVAQRRGPTPQPMAASRSILDGYDNKDVVMNPGKNLDVSGEDGVSEIMERPGLGRHCLPVAESW